MELKPTFEKPLSKAGKTIDKEFNPHLTEVDAVLNEKEQSFKKKVWDLSKMESLVFSDPKLNAKYDDMSEDGQEKYGYHYNETIMNMLFNEYVTNDSGYRQKYLNAIPDEKERRDKSGIHQLQQKGEEKMQRNSAAPKARTEGDVPTHNNSLEGVIEEDGIMDNNLNHDGGGTFDDREYLNHRINKKYDTTPNTMDTNEDLHKGNVYRLNKQSSDQGSISQLNKDAMNDPDPLNIDGYDTFKIEMIPKEDAAVVWGKVYKWITKDEFIQIKSEYYDEDNDLVKSDHSYDFKIMDGRLIPTRIEIIPANEEGKKTVIYIKETKFDIDLPESFFSQQQMKRIR